MSMIKDHDAAEILFLKGISQKEIARILSISEQTISRWKSQFKWEDKLSRKALFQQTAAEQVQELIEYNLRVLKSMKDKWINEGEKKLIQKGDIDALSKLFAAIKKQEAKWVDYVSVIREFALWLEEQDANLAKKVVDTADRFLNAKRKTLS